VREFAAAWYSVLNSIFMAIGAPLRDLAPGAGGSVLTAILLGVIGATSPCQLSTNASAIAYLGNSFGRYGGRSGLITIAYVAGKVLMYSGAGLLAVSLGQGLAAVTVPTVTVARKALGPLMILVGLALLGVCRPRLGFWHALSVRIQERAGAGVIGAFLLGGAFSLAFCPTLGLLFFGYVLPMALVSGAGPLYPAAFALGTTVPLILVSSLLGAGLGMAQLEQRVRAWEPWLRRTAGLIFFLSGINDTLLYWFL